MTQKNRIDRYPQEQEYHVRFSLRWLLPRFWSAWLGAFCLAALMFLPWRLREWLAQQLGRRLLSRHKKRRRIVDINLAWCFPERSAVEREAMAVNYFIHAARSLLDFGLLTFAGSRHLRRRIVLRDAQHYFSETEQGRRVILLTCHTLALEFGALALTQRHKMVGLIKSAENPVFNYLLTRARTRFMGRLFKRDAGIRNIVRAIRADYAFYYLPDEDLGDSKQTTFLPFFGIPTATLTALGRLARACEAVVVPCYSYFDTVTGRYITQFFPALNDFPVGDEVRDALRMNQELERMIRVSPEQYMWSFSIFKTRPGGGANPYKEKK